MDFVRYTDFSMIPQGTIGKININVYDWPIKGTKFIVLECECRADSNEVYEVKLKILANNKIETIFVLDNNEISLLKKE